MDDVAYNMNDVILMKGFQRTVGVRDVVFFWRMFWDVIGFDVLGKGVSLLLD